MPVDPCFASLLSDPRNEARRPPAHVSMEKARRAANAAMVGSPGPQLHAVAELAFLATGHILTRDAMRWFWQSYLGRDDPTPDPLFAPLGADLGGLPPTGVATAECDILRDEGEAFVDRLAAAGVPARRRRYAGMIHGFALFPQITGTATACLEDLAGDLAAALQG